MNTTTTLFDRYKAALGVRSDRQAALRLGVKVQTVSNWRTRGSQAEAATIDAMCEQLGEDPMPWLVRVQAEQGGEESRNTRVWRRVALRLGVSLSVLALACDTLVQWTTAALDGDGALAMALPFVQAGVPGL